MEFGIPIDPCWSFILCWCRFVFRDIFPGATVHELDSSQDDSRLKSTHSAEMRNLLIYVPLGHLVLSAGVLTPVTGRWEADVSRTEKSQMILVTEENQRYGKDQASTWCRLYDFVQLATSASA